MYHQNESLKTGWAVQGRKLSALIRNDILNIISQQAQQSLPTSSELTLLTQNHILNIISQQNWQSLCNAYICTNIIDEYSTSVRIMYVISHTTYVVFVNFIYEYGDLQFKVHSKQQIFEKIVHGNFIIPLRVFARNLQSYGHGFFKFRFVGDQTPRTGI